MEPTKQDFLRRLEPVGQTHLLDFWDELADDARRRLSRQIEDIDFEMLAQLYAAHEEGESWAELARRAGPPPAVRLGPDADGRREESVQRGAAALRDGTVGMILVAGGQGTRLGFDYPKGMFPIGPVSHRTLFQVIIDHLRAVSARYRTSLPLFVMTSPATHAETIEYLERNNRFGLPAGDLHIFCQGTMPAIDARTGQVLMTAKDQLFLGPNGHGGMLEAFDRSGCLADARRRGIRHLFYGQVDNPLLQVCSAELIGHHMLAGSELTTQVVAKRDATERVGNVVMIDGRLHIIEYSDLPAAEASRLAGDGTLELWAGNIAVHVFDADYLDRCARDKLTLPFHRALKTVSYMNREGVVINPVEPNAMKFERFIFDLLPSARHAMVVEVDPAIAFAPVKNASGTDSPETARAAMSALHRQWLSAAGAKVGSGVEVEIAPAWAMDADDVASRSVAAAEIMKPTFFE